MAEQFKTNVSKPDLEKLQHLSNLLHLFHHRNKNQHRRSVWWRHFSVFRRQLNSLVAEVQSLHEVPATHLQRTKKKAQDRQMQDRISKRLELWRNVLLPKWHSSFSQVIADGRFTVLGLMLVAALGQTCHITGLTSGFDDAEVTEGNKILANEINIPEDQITKSNEAQVAGEEDVGEVIARYEDSDETPKVAKRNVEKDAVTAKRSKSSATTSNLPRKRKKTGNAIDDLFSSLG